MKVIVIVQEGEAVFVEPFMEAANTMTPETNTVLVGKPADVYLWMDSNGIATEPLDNLLLSTYL